MTAFAIARNDALILPLTLPVFRAWSCVGRGRLRSSRLLSVSLDLPLPVPCGLFLFALALLRGLLGNRGGAADFLPCIGLFFPLPDLAFKFLGGRQLLPLEKVFQHRKRLADNVEGGSSRADNPGCGLRRNCYRW